MALRMILPCQAVIREIPYPWTIRAASPVSAEQAAGTALGDDVAASAPVSRADTPPSKQPAKP